MKNIVERPIIVAYRGQTYVGDRNEAYSRLASCGEGGQSLYVFGDGEYFSTSYADASTYASVNPAINRDFSGNIHNIARNTGESYSDVRARAMAAGDGQVITAYLTPRRMMVFGDGCFTDIPDRNMFVQRFNLALVENDIPSDRRERIIDLVIKHNDDPEAVLNILMDNQASGALKNYASICNCDVFMVSPSITPISTALRKYGEPVSHIMVLDPAIIHRISVDNPINMNPKTLMFPESPEQLKNEVLKVLAECKLLENENLSKFAAESPVLAGAMAGAMEEIRGGRGQQVKPERSEPKVSNPPRTLKL